MDVREYTKKERLAMRVIAKQIIKNAVDITEHNSADWDVENWVKDFEQYLPAGCEQIILDNLVQNVGYGYPNLVTGLEIICDFADIEIEVLWDVDVFDNQYAQEIIETHGLREMNIAVILDDRGFDHNMSLLHFIDTCWEWVEPGGYYRLDDGRLILLMNDNGIVTADSWYDLIRTRGFMDEAFSRHINKNIKRARERRQNKIARSDD